jgi:dipeptidase E
MRLYLSSEHLGKTPQKFADLLGGSGRVAIINNAADAYAQESKAQRLEVRKAELKAIGLEGSLLDLRKFFGKKEELARELEAYDAVLAVGGNAFLLRRAMYDSGFDEAIVPLLQADKIVYAGYSAGSCVAAPTLIGIELMDQPEVVQQVYKKDPVWEGLNLVSYSIVPHYKSNHPESPAAEKVFDFFMKETTPFKTLADGQVIIVNGEEGKIVG